jgi:predicted MFS family arabinose efflux permease
MPVKRNLYLLALTMFIVGTDGFVVAGVLEDIAMRTGVSIEAAGQIITVFALAYAIASPIIASAFGRMDRKHLLFLSMAVFTLGNLIVALTTDYSLLMAGRIVSAAGASAATPAAITIAGMISPPERRGRAISHVFSGLTIATILGVPFGTYLSHALDYRRLFLVIAIGGAVMCAVLSAAFSRLPPPPNVPLRERLAAVRMKGAPSTLLVTVVVFLSAFTVYSYVSAYYGGRGIASGDQLSWVLLAFGVGGAAGNLLGGRLTDRFGARTTNITSLLGLCLSFVLIALAAHTFFLAVALTFIWGVCGWLLAPAQQYRLMELGGERAQILISWNSSCIYLGIGLSGVVGALVIRLLGTPALTWAGGAGALIGALLTALLYAPRLAGEAEQTA